MPSQIEQLINAKNAWMARHITEAEFPTPLSKQGLALYQQQQQSSQQISSIPDTPEPALTIYPVDCHPLTIRYALVLSSKWQDEAEKEAVVEFLTQMIFDDESPAQLFVGFYKGKPAACGMLYHTNNGLSLVSDIYALPLANQQALIEEMESRILAKAGSDNNRTLVISRSSL